LGSLTAQDKQKTQEQPSQKNKNEKKREKKTVVDHPDNEY